jgi:predicted short-subunit dehydrogenase-like oxidoreductase (DUF2520 family)
MIKVVILGAGNIAFHLTTILLKTKKVELLQVYNKNLTKIEYLKHSVEITNKLSDLNKNGDIYIIAISDDAISDFSKQLILPNKLVVHTSGSVALNDLESNSNKGVFYPLQSFSKNKKVTFNNVPICIEAETSGNLKLLEKLAKIISNKCYIINSEQRKQVHLAAVFVNNFVNHLYYLGNKICDENNISFEILHPLIKETSKKLEELSPFEAQTGPAKRNDVKTMEKQLEMLPKKSKEIYTLLSNSILKTYGKKL